MAILLFSLIFNLVLVIFIVISIFLIYSLIMIGVETKTFETGIMRMVGVSKKGLLLMIFMQTCMFVLPAIILAFILCFPVLALCYSQIFKEKLTNGFEPVPSWNAIVLAIIVGLFIPLLSSILPLMKVLGQNLNDALNYERNRVKAIYVKIFNKSKADLIPQIIFGILVVAYGFCIFYLLPLSMLSFNLGLILEVFFAILISMLFGLCMLAINIQSFLERFLTYVLLFWEKNSMKKIILNNLKAHMMRNKNTSTIFSMALGFIIFMMVSYRL